MYNIQENSVQNKQNLNLSSDTFLDNNIETGKQYEVSQEEIDEINKEMEDLFGSPMSNVRI